MIAERSSEKPKQAVLTQQDNERVRKSKPGLIKNLSSTAADTSNIPEGIVHTAGTPLRRTEALLKTSKTQKQTRVAQAFYRNPTTAVPDRRKM